MCLDLRHIQSDTPFNGDNIRWKMLKVAVRAHYPPRIESQIYNATWNLGSKKRSMYVQEVDCRHYDFGIHVFVNRSDAEHLAYHYLRHAPYPKGEYAQLLRDARRFTGTDIHVVARLRVSGFLKSGYYPVNYSSKESETWKYAELIDIYHPFTGRPLTQFFRELQAAWEKKV
jgi:hypothetical protein